VDLHVDFAFPFQGRTYLMVTDAHSKWPEIIEIRSTTLKELNISNNNITSVGAKWIAEAVGQNKVLQKLDILHNDI